jgi:hypothetical protein
MRLVHVGGMMTVIRNARRQGDWHDLGTSDAVDAWSSGIPTVAVMMMHQ